MSDIKKKLNEVLVDLEKNIKNKEELEYVKAQIYNISMLFLDEIDKLAELNLGKLNTMLNREKELNKRISDMEKIVKNIEKEMYISEDCDFSIQCPYCNTEFVEDFSDGWKNEVKCPECDNTIQLEWANDEECDCEHSDICHGECCGNVDDEETNGEDDSLEDDM